MMSLSKIIKNARGQMAIFIALIFQVLFLFFAMAINVGLAVHDKINLQNATDLAAFYVAEKQAEILNAIAHTNYQIRQAYKVLNFRYYYLGTLGYTDAPSRSPNAVYPERVPFTAMTGTQAPTPVCIAYGPMWAQSTSDNICRSHNYSVANITIPPIIAAFIPTTIVFNQVAQQMQGQLIGACNKYAAYNWWFAATIYVAYDLEQAARKGVIHALAANLQRPIADGGMVDMQGESVFEGARKTFLKNLTYRNRVSNPQFQVFNSLQQFTNITDVQTWLPDIEVFFTIPYQDIDANTSACTGIDRLVQQVPLGQDSNLQIVSGSGPNLANLKLMVSSIRSLPQGDLRRLAVGVEKNPWYWVYAGVKTSTTPTQLFSPFGGTTFTAKAFAQPFGGRIGPWYQSSWSPSKKMSDGPNHTEPMEPPRLDWISNNPNLPIIPGYSRYPGDALGETSMAYLNSFIGLNDSGTLHGDLTEYRDILSAIGPNTPNDTLAFNTANPAVASSLRSYEVAAAAPDLFDITYYSIQPDWGNRYLNPLINNAAALGIPGNIAPFADVGSRATVSTIKFFSVRDQINSSTHTIIGGTQTNIHQPSAFWYVQDLFNVLTAWVPNDAYADYADFPDDRFGKCATSGINSNPLPPGDCANNGGRTGYSVKLFSPTMFKQALPLGGGSESGLILNPPDPSF